MNRVQNYIIKKRILLISQKIENSFQALILLRFVGCSLLMTSIKKIERITSPKRILNLVIFLKKGQLNTKTK